MSSATCASCKQIKLLTEFFKRTSTKRGAASYCKSCMKKKFTRIKICNNCKKEVKTTKKSNKPYKCWDCSVRKFNKEWSTHEKWIWHKFKITGSQYKDLQKLQNNNCAICKRAQNEFKRKFAVDHCHKTNKVRGLLCMDCNVAIGHLKNNFSLCLSAADYLRRYSK